MENVASQSIFKLSTTNSYKNTNKRVSKPGLVPQVNFDLPFDSNVFLKLIDNTGKLVRMLINGKFLRRGRYSNEIILNDLQPGEYYCVIETGDSREARAIRVIGNSI